MATASDIRAGGAFVELYLKGGHLVEQGLDKIANKTKAFATALSTMASVANISYGHSATAMRTSLTTIANVIDKVGAGIRVSMQTISKVANATMDGIVASIRKTGQVLQSLGTKTLFAGLLGGGVGVQTMGLFMEYERQMSRVKALTGATGQLFEDVTAQVRQLGRTTQYTVSEVAEGMAYLAMAGLKARDAIDVLPTVLDLATAAQMPLGQTADIVTDIGLAFGYTGKETKRVADVLAQASTNSNTTVEKMGNSFKYLASFAVGAGQSIEEMATALALLAQVGIKANTAGTGTREALINMVTPAKRRKIQDIIGVDIANARGEMRPLFDIIADLQVKLQRFNQVKRLELMTQIFGKRGGNVMLSLTNMDIGSIENMRRIINDSDGAVEKMAGTMRDNLWGSWKAFVSVIQDVQVEIGQALVPAVRGFLDYFTKAIRSIGEYIAKNKELVVGISLSIPALLAAGAAALVFGKALTTIAAIATPVFSAVSVGVAGMTGVVIGATAALGVLSTTIHLVASAIQTMAAVAQSTVGLISMLSIATAGWVALSIGGVKLLIYSVKSVAKTIMSIATLTLETTAVVGAATTKTAATAVAEVMAVGLAVKQTIATTLMSIGAMVLKITAALLPFIAVAVAIWAAFKIVPALITAAIGVVRLLVAIVQKLAVSFWEVASSIGAALGTALLGTINAVGKALVNTGEAVANYFQKHKNAFAGLIVSFKKVFGQLKETYEYVVMALQSGDIESAMELIKLEAFRQLINLEFFARKLLLHLLEEVPKFVVVVGNILKSMFEGIGDVFMDLWTMIKQEFRIVIAELKAQVFEVFTHLKHGRIAREEANNVRNQVHEERARAVVERQDPKNLQRFDVGKQKHDAQILAEQARAVDTPKTRAKQKELDDLKEQHRREGGDKFLGLFDMGETAAQAKKRRELEDELKALIDAEHSRRAMQVIGNDADVKFFLDAVAKDIPAIQLDWQWLKELEKVFKDGFEAFKKMGDAERAEIVRRFGVQGNTWQEQWNYIENLINEKQDSLKKNHDERQNRTNDGKSDAQVVAEKEKSRLETLISDMKRVGIGEELLKEQNRLLEEQNKIIKEEMRGFKGVNEHGQSTIHSVRFYESLLEAIKRLEKTLPKHIAESEAFRAAVKRREIILGLRKKLDGEGGDFKNQADWLRFNELRVQDYVAQGVHRERAEAHVERENRQFERDRRVHEIRQLEMERDDAIKERSELTQGIRNIEQKRNRPGFDNGVFMRMWKKDHDELTAKINSANQAIAQHKRELNKFDKNNPDILRQTRGINADYMERVLHATFAGGSFSAYDIMRGGVERNDVLSELRKQTYHLESIDENMNAGQGQD